MSRRVKNLSAFDLKFLKALLNLKINEKYTSDLSTDQKRDLCITHNWEDGIIKLHPDHLTRIMPMGKEISHSVSLNTLNQLCSILKKEYKWHSFSADISVFRPENISEHKSYSELSNRQQELIDKTLTGIFFKYRTFELFKKEIIDKIETENTDEKNKITLDLSVKHSAQVEKIKTFANRIYIELITRKAAIPIDEKKDVIEEVYNSWYKLFCIIREEMKSLPVSYLKEENSASTIFSSTIEILNEVLRTHLTEHQSKFRNWLQVAKAASRYKKIAPQELQKKYPEYKILISSLKQINKKLINFSQQLYNFTNES